MTPPGPVFALAAGSVSGVAAVFTGGQFASAGAGRVGRLSNGAWGPIAQADGYVYALSVQSGSLYAGGDFVNIGGAHAAGVARWDGSFWSSLGAGIGGSGPAGFPVVYALCPFDDGSGPALYVGGYFFSADGNPAACIARWTGQAWQTLPGVGGSPFGVVYALAVHDDGHGPALYMGGQFSRAGGVEANNIARWNGTAWEPLAAGVSGVVFSLCSWHGPGPSVLCAGGTFSAAGGNPAFNIASWDGAGWSALGAGLGTATAQVRGLATEHPDGSGALYAGGQFQVGSGANVGRWDGTAWMPVGIGTSSRVIALQSTTEAFGPALYAGGQFATAGGYTTPDFARWMCVSCYANCDASTSTPILNVVDFGCFLNRFSAGDSYANCDASTTPPTLNVNDFICFVNSFVAGCH